MSTSRQLLAASGLAADANVQPRHPADAAAWVWHPDSAPGQTAFLRFVLELEIAEPVMALRLHVTADQRFQLRVDGEVVGYGPDRSEVENWSVATYTLPLGVGAHRIEALVWWLQDDTVAGATNATLKPPVAQATWRAGFLLAGENEFAERVNTGRAPWRVEDLTAAVRTVRPAFYAYHDIGPEFHVDGTLWDAPSQSVPAAVIVAAILGNPHGVQRPGWRLQPSMLPEQARTAVTGGRVRALSDAWTDGPFSELGESTEASDGWRDLISGRGELVVPPHSEQTVVWDFEDHVCGYATLATTGGRGSRVRIDWAEALHESATRGAVTKDTTKGHRGEIAGKLFYGFGDEFLASDGDGHFPAWWWRAGRYLRVQVRTADAALTIRALTITATGYPLGDAARFASEDAALNEIAARCEKTIRACAHEVWTDCPYYEQMAYVGDSRLAGLNNYALFADDRLSRRMLVLFDESRRVNGLVAERAPASWQQVSVTYSLLWVLMVRDFAWWRDDVTFVRARLRGVRAMLDEVLALVGDDGLLGVTPGWPFVDWVPAWHEGCGPGVREGDSSIVNLHLLLALRAQVELENNFGEPELAALASRRADALAQAILARFWSDARGLLADTSARNEFSEHAQALGVLADLVPTGGVARWVDAWQAARDLARATIYFSFYTMEALRRAGRGEALHARFQLWRDVLATGLLTMPEAPEPTRSDCHGWSAHVRWHLAASVAGVRPSAPGFARVEIAPLFGGLHAIDAEVRHPRGVVRVSLRRAGDRLIGGVTLPDGVEAELRWNGRTRVLPGGVSRLDEF